MALDHIVALVGGVGGAKLALGLAKILPPQHLTIIVNTADDFWHYGLRISPDLDTVMYNLAGMIDPINGWGLAGDTTITLDALRQDYGEETWFRLGDRDMATHLLRTMWWHEGVSLTEIVRRLSSRLGIEHTILPMTDYPVETIVETVTGERLVFQKYFVWERWQPVVKTLHYKGIESATMSQAVKQAIETADAILIAPSNPFLSIAPILAVPGLRDAVIARDVPRVAISPIIGGKAVKGPAAKLMAELGYTPSASAVAEYYGIIVNGFVYDAQDADLTVNTPRATTFDTFMQSDADKVALAQNILNWITDWD
ncbi:MAG: 2-phospho-L-lactate transferase [Chloroflexi bacterium]|nr:MAG: 2-phospho-L-lactate transferase [Chloroflexota bacterium]